MDYSKYPENWKEISLAIRNRENWKCKFCAVANGAWGYRYTDGTFIEVAERSIPIAKQFYKIIKIVLTVAHLGTTKPDGTTGDPHDKMDCRPENLAALCQRCRLRYDSKEHRVNTAKTRHNKKLAAGQTEMSL